LIDGWQGVAIRDMFDGIEEQLPRWMRSAIVMNQTWGQIREPLGLAMDMPDRVIVQLCFLTPMRNQRRLRRVLWVFHAFPSFAPTHWSPRDERSLPPFGEAVAIRDFIADRHDRAMAVFKRNKNPRYDGFLFARADHLDDMRLKFGKVTSGRAYQALYDFGSALAGRVEPGFGFVHPVWMLGNKSQEYSVAARITAAEIEHYGLRSLCARTWLGPRLTEVLGKSIGKCGLAQRSVAKNLTQVDLVENPWVADFATLGERLEQVMSALTRTGWFGDYAIFGKYKKGKKWAPFGKKPG
jgi:hypothetical protein